MKTNYIAICDFQVKVQAARFQVFPAGTFRASDGRPQNLSGWCLSEMSAKKLLATLATRKNPVVIDFEHQTLNASKNGQPAPAAGWAQNFEWTSEGFFAVEPSWTEKAKNFIANDEYRYISPVFTYHPHSGDVLDLHSIALTNHPALDGMHPVALTTLEKMMNPEILKSLNLLDTATDVEVLAAIQKLLDGKVAAATQVDPSQFVPVQVVQELQTAFAALKQQVAQDGLSNFITEHKDYFPTPGLIAWAKQQNLESLREYVKNATPIAALNATQTGGKPPVGDKKALTESEQAVCRALKIPLDKYQENK